VKLYLYFFCLLVSRPLFAAEFQIVTIAAEKHPHEFVIEIALTPKQHERGLMFRKYLPYKHGMLFLYKRPQLARFWMKNTFIPLDLIFIDSQDKIIQIHEHAQPLSQDLICSKKPIKAILELFAGSVARYNIKINQSIKMSSIRKRNDRVTSPN
jgi:uncharacterized membrane protein (UPF0127 family)